jgi:hypothetical protein
VNYIAQWRIFFPSAVQPDAGSRVTCAITGTLSAAPSDNSAMAIDAANSMRRGPDSVANPDPTPTNRNLAPPMAILTHEIKELHRQSLDVL